MGGLISAGTASSTATGAERPPYLVLDTNVWIDFYLQERTGHEVASELLKAAARHGAELLYPVHSSKDVYFIIAADAKRRSIRKFGAEHAEEAAKAADAFAWGCIDYMSRQASAVPCDHTDIWLAEKQRGLHSDFEDDLVIAAAMRAKADLLVTNDDKLLRHSPVPTLGASDAIAWLDSRE